MTKDSETTQIAVFSEKLASIQKTVDRVDASMAKFTESKFVTQNEMQMAIKDIYEKVAKDLLQMSGKIDSTNKVLYGILTTIVLTVVGAVMKLVLKI